MYDSRRIQRSAYCKDSFRRILTIGLALVVGGCTIKGRVDDLPRTPIETVPAILPTVQFQTVAQSAGETVGSVSIVVTLNTASTSTTTIPFSTSGTASVGADFTVSSSTVSIPPGQISASILISIVNDGFAESPETVILTLGTPTHATLGTNTVHTLTIATSCDPSITTSYGGGLGTTLSPFTICNLDQWNYFAADTPNWDKIFRLESDLDFASVALSDFKMIGNNTTPFTGSLLGNSKTIKNISLTGGSTDLGLFLNTDGTVKISDLTLQDVSIVTSGKVGTLVVEHGSAGSLTLDAITATNIALPSAGQFSAHLVSRSNAPFIANQLTLSNFTRANGANYSAGLISICGSTCTLTNIAAAGITKTNTGVGGYTGGLVSYSVGAFVASDINMTTADIRSLDAGGIVSTVAGDATFTRVHVSGSVFSNTDAGGLVARSDGFGSRTLTITESSFNGTVYGGGGAGGLAHFFVGDVHVTDSYVKGGVYTGSNAAGGLFNFIGTDAGKSVLIEDSYVAATVQSADLSFGLAAGLVNSGGSSDLDIRRTYFSGNVLSNNSRSCILASQSSGSRNFADVYFDSTLCTAAQSQGNPNYTGVTALATASLQSATPFTNWLSTVWTFTNGMNPKLVWEP